MTYQPVDIPFFAGQDESYDRKVLPVGPLRRVENAHQERSGRMVEKFGMVDRPTGGFADSRFINALPNDIIMTESQGGVRAGKYTDTTYRLLEGSQSSQFGYVESLNAAPSSTTTETFCPSVGVTSTHIIFCYISGLSVDEGSTYHIDIYDRDTLEIVNRLTRSVTAAPGIQIKVSAKPTGKSFVVVIKANSLQLNLTYFEDETVPSWPDAADSILTDVALNSTFDLSDERDSDTGFWVVYLNSSTGDVLATRFVRIAGVPPGFSFTSTPDFVPELDQYLFCGIAAMSVGAALVAYTYHSAGQNYLGRQVFNEGIPGTTTTITIDGVVTAPCMAVRAGLDECTLAYGEENNTVLRIFTLANSLATAYTSRRSFPVGSSITASNSLSAKEGAGDLPVGEMSRGDNTEDIRGTVSLCNPGLSSKFGEPSGILLRAGGSDISRVAVGLYEGTGSTVDVASRWTPAKTVQWLEDGKGQTLICVEERLFEGKGLINLVDELFNTWSTRCMVRVLSHKRVRHQVFGESWDRGNSLTSGAGVGTITDPVSHFGGFTGAPIIRVGKEITGVQTLIGPGEYQYIAVLEYTDPTGRVWRSIPSEEQKVTLDGVFPPDGTNESAFYSAIACAGSPTGSRIVIYRTKAGVSIFYRLTSIDYEATESPVINRRDFIHDDDLSDIIIYTGGGVLPNDPPPLGRYITRTRNRFWVGMQEFPARVQASKFLRPTEGVHWSNVDNFAVDIPEAVTGLSSMDDTLVVFSENEIYLVHGDGPTDQGAGAFSPPQKIPTDVGCTEARSIVVGDAGIYFLSRRGIELINRGFSAPQFVGDPVRDVTDAFPFCIGAAVLQEAHQIRWLLSDTDGGTGGEAQVLVFDTRTKAWSVFRYGNGPLGIGHTDSENRALYPKDGTTHYFEFVEQSQREVLVRNETATPAMVWETGELRPGGLNAGVYGRRVHILGTYKGPCSVTLTMGFNDARDFTPKWTKTWVLTDADYTADDPITLELTLPLAKFWAVRFRLTALRTNIGAQGFQAHGMTVFFDSEGEGPRVGARSKG